MALSVNSKTPFKMPISPLQVLLLIQLEGGHKYGYEMLKTLKEEFKGTWEPKTGTVYPALKSLAKKGFVVTIEKDGTDYYQITEEGKTVFPLMKKHIEDSTEFGITYLSVIFKWMTRERKQAAMELLEKLTEKEQLLTKNMMQAFYENIDMDIKEPFLRQIKSITTHRLNMVEKILETIRK